MKFIFASYVYTPEFDDPRSWLIRINAYTGIPEALSQDNEVISIEQINYEGHFHNKGVDYHFKRFSQGALRFFPFKLNTYIKSLQPDVVVIQGLHYPFQVIQLRLLLGNKTKIIAQNHAEKPFGGLKKYLQKLADLCINTYLFASHPMGMQWIKAGNLASAEKIHEVMEVSSVFYPMEKEVAKARTNVNGNPVFLWVGRLNANKDPLTVISAFVRYLELNENAKLYMLYHTEELLEEIKSLLGVRYKNSVILVGKVPHADLLYWFNSADFILSGSHYEGSGTAICEAMSCGCIPLVTDILSFRMITNDGACGILYEPGNADALLSVLKKIEEIDIEAKQRITLDYFQDHLSFQAIASQINQIAGSL
ncbi:glycosyltransferase family 4 protein [Dyadobacter frigoris]|uniref:Glycosyltransferase family 4 protein n=1 Tax=Dyadobacter frigoris TaxID=2576211 RepID=A0A4U6D3U7_9BACT|nr:glycosyltransferase family 4 protein [Dyadobacter frigoris]TKT90598.1 glycosyltransferase family 4 protein [Dyadobacter frigoris]GLU51253.1 hypothetical protein Dfri01_07140 [Dyadobacter frigoris]